MAEIGAGSGSDYPTSLDTNSNPEVDSPNAGKTLRRADVYNDINACIIAIETELGTDPAGTKADVKTYVQTEHSTAGAHEVFQGAVNFGADAEVTDTYVIGLGAALTAYVTGAHYNWTATTPNTGACTLNIDSLGAKAIKKYVPSGKVDLDTGDIVAGQAIRCMYDGTDMVMISNPAQWNSQAGTGTARNVPSGAITINTTGVGNGSFGTENDMITYSLPANSLVTTGHGVRIKAWGVTAATATKTIKLYFGATVLVSSGAQGINSTDWQLEGLVFRTGSNTQDGFGIFDTGDAYTRVTSFTTPAETETGAITIKTTGEASTSTDRITTEGLMIEFLG